SPGRNRARVCPHERGPQAEARHGEGGAVSTEPGPDGVLGCGRPTGGRRPRRGGRRVGDLPGRRSGRSGPGLVIRQPRGRCFLSSGAHCGMSTVRGLQSSAAALESATAAKFPAAQYAHASAYFDTYADEIAQAAKSADRAALDRAAAILVEAYAGGRRVFSCGNGGSGALANHLQCDHIKNVRASTDLAPRVQSLCANVELLTAIANDIAYDNVFAYQLQSLAEPGDVLIAVTSSGRSPNIVCALAWARDHGLKTIAL